MMSSFGGSSSTLCFGSNDMLIGDIFRLGMYGRLMDREKGK